MLRKSLVSTAMAAILAAGGLLTSGAPAAAQDVTIELVPLPGSGAQATLELTAPMTAVATATGIGGYEGSVMIHVLDRPHCDWEGRLAIVFDLAANSEALTEGVTMDGVLAIYEDVPPGNVTEGLFGGAISDVQSALMFAYPESEIEEDIQYLACGNVDGSPVIGWEGLLDENLRLVAPAAGEAPPEEAAPAEVPAAAAPAGTGGYLSDGGASARIWAAVLAVAGLALTGVGARGLLRRG